MMASCIIFHTKTKNHRHDNVADDNVQCKSHLTDSCTEDDQLIKILKIDKLYKHIQWRHTNHTW